MTMPTDIGIIDLMMGIPSDNQTAWYEFLKPQLRDESAEYEFPVQYMFKGVPKFEPGTDHVKLVLDQMDRYGVEKSMLGFAQDRSNDVRAITEHPDRFFGAYSVDPNKGMDGVRALVRAYELHGAKAAMAFPAGYLPQVPINDKKMFPLYAKCIELDIPICVTAGIAGPRVPSACQDVALVDEVCWYFPELKFVFRHGCEPWADLAVKLMLKWPNLYYSTSAFAPRYYPSDVIDFANTRGADKVMYAGYFPMGLSLERIMHELPNVPLKAEVWPKFLRDNAVRVFQLD